MRRKFITFNFFISFLLFILLSCTDVHAPRIKIFCFYNEPGSNVAIEKTIEISQKMGSKVSLASLRFPQVSFKSSYPFGYKDGSKFYILKSTIGATGEKGYLFNIESDTSYVWNTNDPLPISMGNLYPIYEEATEDDSSQNIDKTEEPGVRIEFYYNDSTTKEIKSGSCSYTFKASDASKTLTLSSLSLFPEAQPKAWPIYDTEGQQDRLFYGYVDTNNYNKAYYFNRTPVEFSQDIVDYHFMDQNGTVYNTTTPLDTSKYILLKPKYIEAGYRPIEDYLGTCADPQTATGVGPMTLKSVFVPGSYTYPWPYEFRSTIDAVPYDTSFTIGTDTLTDGISNVIEDLLVCEMPIQVDFLKKMFINNPNISYYAGTSGNTFVAYINGAPDDETYTFELSNSVLNTATNSANLSFWGGNYLTHIILCNLLTSLHNINNPDDQLTYVYHSTQYFNSPIRNCSSVITDSSQPLKSIFTDYTATGYRLPTYAELSYMGRIITDERQLPTSPYMNGNNAIKFVKRKEELGTKHAFKSLVTSNYFTSGSQVTLGNYTERFMGFGVGLAWYDNSTGTYTDKTRLSWHVAGIPNTSQVSTNYPHFWTTKGVLEYDTKSEPTSSTFIEVDYNRRNGAGIWGIGPNSARCLTDTQRLSSNGYKENKKIETVGYYPNTTFPTTTEALFHNTYSVPPNQAVSTLSSGNLALRDSYTAIYCRTI